MTANQKYLDEAEARAKAFEAEGEPERLREAYMALESVNLSQEPDRASHDRVRSAALAAWLGLISTLDRHLDPTFDPNEKLERFVQPPEVLGGVVLPPGADPALVPDPVARAKYEKAVAANRAKLERLQSQYTSDPRDQAEFRAAIDKLVTNPKRKAKLLTLLSRRREQGG